MTEEQWEEHRRLCPLFDEDENGAELCMIDAVFKDKCGDAADCPFYFWFTINEGV